MSSYAHRSTPSSPQEKILAWFQRVVPRDLIQNASLFTIIIFCALIAFEIFNFSTTEYALTDLLGQLEFAGATWATILALAFCGIDFAGIARLFTPARKEQDQVEVWYLLGAWLLAATMNASLTWWSVSLALINHGGLGNEIIGRESLVRSVPIFVAVLVWLIRVLMIGTITMMGSRLTAQTRQPSRRPRTVVRAENSQRTPERPSPLPSSRRPNPRPKPTSRRKPQPSYTGSQDSSYHPLPLSARSDRKRRERMQ